LSLGEKIKTGLCQFGNDWQQKISGALNLFELRPFEREAFLAQKEAVYSERRDRVSEYCRYLLQQSNGVKGELKQDWPVSYLSAHQKL
jgi:hypothetical protein